MSDDILKISTPRGDGRSMTPLSPYDVNVSYAQAAAAPGGGADWFGPLAPMRPIAPPEVAGRTWDFLPGWNLNTEPRPYEAITFETLRTIPCGSSLSGARIRCADCRGRSAKSMTEGAASARPRRNCRRRCAGCSEM